MRGRTLIALTLAAGTAQAAGATVALEDCTRITRGWNGGEAGHRDLGAGRVAFGEWWSAEGVYTDLVVSDCASGESLRSRVRQENFSAALPYDRTDRAVAVVERHARRSPALFRIGALADDLGDIGEDTVIFVTDTEFCACAALYPGMRGDKTAYEGP